MPLRNPFAKRTGLETVDDANLNPTGAQTRPSFEKVDTVGSKSSARSIQSGRSQEPAEYKMSARLPRLPRSAIGERRFENQPPTAEEGFEDVGLNDEQGRQTKKKGFFSKFGDNSDSGAQSTSGSRFHITGRKRGQSGTGEELGNIQPSSGFHIPGRKRGQSGVGEELKATQTLGASESSAEVEGAH
ncbi:hypothetical protein DH86_00003799 [Scytalidium sp. 3C]|nr:hypothetical protein DH86_00003799 [Scytalidium sp. 3C]